MRLIIKGGSLEAEIQDNPLETIQQQLKQLASMTKIGNIEIDKLKTKITNLAQRESKTITKTIVKIVKFDEGIAKLNNTIQNIKRTPVSKYPKTEFRVRQSIARAGVPVHSSDSDMQDKLNAKPRMPI